MILLRVVQVLLLLNSISVLYEMCCLDRSLTIYDWWVLWLRGLPVIVAAELTVRAIYAASKGESCSLMFDLARCLLGVTVFCFLLDVVAMFYQVRSAR